MQQFKSQKVTRAVDARANSAMFSKGLEPIAIDQGRDSMEVVRQILQSRGLSDCGEMAVGDSVTVTAQGLMDLTIEKIGVGRISVGHYYTQHGDLISDPEVVFRIDGDGWMPVRFTQHPNIHQYDESGLSDIGHFLETWEQNIQRQGYLEGKAQALEFPSKD